MRRYRRAIACLPDDVQPEQLTGLREERGWTRHLGRRPRHQWWRSGAAVGYVFESVSLVLVGGGVILHAVPPRDETPAAPILKRCGIAVAGGSLAEALANLPPKAAVEYIVWFRHESCRVHGSVRLRSDELVLLLPEPRPLLLGPQRA